MGKRATLAPRAASRPRQDQHGTLAPSFGAGFGGGSEQEPHLWAPHRAVHACACRAELLGSSGLDFEEQQGRMGHGEGGRRTLCRPSPYPPLKARGKLSKRTMVWEWRGVLLRLAICTSWPRSRRGGRPSSRHRHNVEMVVEIKPRPWHRVVETHYRRHAEAAAGQR